MAERRTQVVCVVDDDESLRRSVRNLLSSVGFRVETFASAEEFLESTHRANTGCLVLDLRMAGMNGLDLLRHLGAMGSRRTNADRLARLRETGVDEARLDRVMAPIGLDIGARTPEETAISICAEIIASHTGRSAPSLRASNGPIHPR